MRLDAVGKHERSRHIRSAAHTGSIGSTHTQVYAAVTFISGRPVLIRRLVTLRDAGCSVQVIYSTISAHDRSELRASGVRLYEACPPADAADNETAEFLHSKFFLVDGSDTTVGHSGRIVYTGSENWNDQSLTNADNRMLRDVDTANHDESGAITADSGIYDDYLARWADGHYHLRKRRRLLIAQRDLRLTLGQVAGHESADHP
jgi:phosphatidylserine/phosphatidylglycerophosphate/cardiolipin synthase-like enzyme